MQTKILRSQKHFGTMCFGLTNQNLATTKDLRKKGEAFVEKNTLPTVNWRWIHNALGLGGSWGHREYCVSVRKNGFHQIFKNSRG